MGGQADLSDSFISHREYTRVAGVGENNLSAVDVEQYLERHITRTTHSSTLSFMRISPT